MSVIIFVDEEKICNLCKKILPLSNFQRCKNHPDGLQYRCKFCCKILSQERKEKLKKTIPIIPFQKMCSKCGTIKSNKEYYKSNYTTDLLDTQCKICVNFRHNINRHKEDPQIRREREKRWREKNPEKMREKYRKQYLKLNYKLKNNLSRRVRSALVGKGTKSSNTVKLLGCSVLEFKNWLEYQFIENMNWDNYGKSGIWEIDHVIPCSSFDLNNEEDQRKCFHWSNMRPLLSTENSIKSNKINDEIISEHYIKYEKYALNNKLQTLGTSRNSRD
jgi:hypothetical protein